MRELVSGPRHSGDRRLLRVREREIGDASSQGRDLWHDGPEYLPRLGLQERGFLCIQGVQVQGAVKRPVPGRVLQRVQSPECCQSLRLGEWLAAWLGSFKSWRVR